ncbi:MAG: hypothetical protein AB1782_08910 [Cyanobacteriota bacterium]
MITYFKNKNHICIFISTILLFCHSLFIYAEDPSKPVTVKDTSIISDIDTTGVTGVNNKLILKDENITDKVKEEIIIDENTKLDELIDLNNSK